MQQVAVVVHTIFSMHGVQVPEAHKMELAKVEEAQLVETFKPQQAELTEAVVVVVQVILHLIFQEVAAQVLL
jgi:hypothetical protein